MVEAVTYCCGCNIWSFGIYFMFCNILSFVIYFVFCNILCFVIYFVFCNTSCFVRYSRMCMLCMYSLWFQALNTYTPLLMLITHSMSEIVVCRQRSVSHRSVLSSQFSLYNSHAYNTLHAKNLFLKLSVTDVQFAIFPTFEKINIPFIFYIKIKLCYIYVC